MDQAERDATLVRIDERTAGLAKSLATHIENDRIDFKEIHSRINRVDTKQSWILGVGSFCLVALGVVGAWLKNT